MSSHPLRVAVIGIDHRHAYGLLSGLVELGARPVGWWTEGSPNTLEGFVKLFPDVPRVDDYRRLLDDKSVDIVVMAPEGADRAGIAIEALEAGKDVMSDKPGVITLEELAAMRSAVERTGRIWSPNFAERFRIPSLVKAKELIDAGEIGRVVHFNGLGPQRLRLNPRPQWFFEPRRFGGILTDLMLHQFDNFIYLTGETQIDIAASWVGNFNQPDHPYFEDLGEVTFGSQQVRGYARVDWYTPDALPLNPGDGRITILGTDGYIEIRKFVDIAGRPGKEHLFIVNKTRCDYVDCSNLVVPGYHQLFMDDVRNRTETCLGHEHVFRVTELSIKAQNLSNSSRPAA